MKNNRKNRKLLAIRVKNKTKIKLNRHYKAKIVNLHNQYIEMLKAPPALFPDLHDSFESSNFNGYMVKWEPIVFPVSIQVQI